MKSQARKILLASSSPYRQSLLKRLEIPFEQANPEVDESRLEGESPAEMAERLSIIKAESLAENHPDWLIIGSDQTIALGETVYGKPGSHKNAVNQLKAFSGQSLTIHTGLCLYDTRFKKAQSSVIDTFVRFKELSDETIEAYLEREKPYKCAGSLKSEGLGTALLSALEGPDPTAVIGLPLIELCNFLENWDVKVI